MSYDDGGWNDDDEAWADDVDDERSPWLLVPWTAVGIVAALMLWGWEALGVVVALTTFVVIVALIRWAL